jgi:hypothetical protein
MLSLGLIPLIRYAVVHYRLLDVEVIVGKVPRISWRVPCC